MKKKEELSVVGNEYRNKMVSISNSMIRSREFTNLLESKIEVLAIHHMDSDLRQREKTDHTGQKYKVQYVVLPANEIRRLMGRSDGNTYTEIRSAASHLKTKLYILEDRENSQFIMKNMYGDIAYDRGTLSIEFNPDMTKYFMNLRENFTKLRLPILFSFKRNGGFQLYKLLKSYAYAPNLEPIDMALSQEELPAIPLTWTLTDLRMIMGYVDINQDALKQEGSKKKPNWEKMVKEEKKPQYKRWADFKKRVIEPGINEINNISDIYIKDVTKELSGHGGKISSITFYVQHNRAFYEKDAVTPTRSDVAESDTEPVMTEDMMDDFVDEMRTFMNRENLKTRDLKAIAEAAGYDMELIRKQYEISKNSSINNLTGWMISAVRAVYDNPKGSPKSNKFSDFELQREYDFDELEAELVKKQKKRRKTAV